MLYFLTASKKLALLALISLGLASCQSSSQQLSGMAEIPQGTITYPFYLNTEPLGNNGVEDKFVIRTISGNTEYVIEIPRAATDYDVAVPLAMAGRGSEAKAPKAKNPQLTDKELVAQFPKLNEQTQSERALLDKAFGVSEKDGPRQAPSYTVGLAKISRLYKENNFEYALIEVNNLLAFYPSSSRLYKMKGSVLTRLGNLPLAEKAWVRASELAPDDPVIKRGISRLREEIRSNRELAKSSEMAGSQIQ